MTPTKNEKKIFALAFANGRPAVAHAYYSDAYLDIVKIQDILGRPDEWLPLVQADIDKHVDSDWVVMVDDKTFSISEKATMYDFDALAETGKTNLQLALDWYFALDERGSIRLDDACKKYALQTGEMSLIELRNDDKGRVVYNVDWNRFSAGHRALLLCVAGAMSEEMYSDRWMRLVCGDIERKKADNIITSYAAITKGFDRMFTKYFLKLVDATESKKFNSSDENMQKTRDEFEVKRIGGGEK